MGLLTGPLCVYRQICLLFSGTFRHPSPMHAKHFSAGNNTAENSPEIRCCSPRYPGCRRLSHRKVKVPHDNLFFGGGGGRGSFAYHFILSLYYCAFSTAQSTSNNEQSPWRELDCSPSSTAEVIQVHQPKPGLHSNELCPHCVADRFIL